MLIGYNMIFKQGSFLVGSWWCGLAFQKVSFWTTVVDLGGLWFFVRLHETKQQRDWWRQYIKKWSGKAEFVDADLFAFYIGAAVKC